MHPIREVAEDEFWKVLSDAHLANPFANGSDTDEDLERFWNWHFALGEQVKEVVSKYGSCGRHSAASDFDWEPPADGSAVIVLQTERGDLVTPSLVSDVFRVVGSSAQYMVVNLEIEEFSSILITPTEILAHYDPDEREVLSGIVEAFMTERVEED